jgi:hypothetical protein
MLGSLNSWRRTSMSRAWSCRSPVLQLRGRDRGTLLRGLGADNSSSSTAVLEVAPWWPIGFSPAPMITRTDGFAATRPERADAVLDGMEALDVAIGGSTFVELLRPIYDQLLD